MVAGGNGGLASAERQQGYVARDITFPLLGLCYGALLRPNFRLLFSLLFVGCKSP